MSVRAGLHVSVREARRFVLRRSLPTLQSAKHADDPMANGCDRLLSFRHPPVLKQLCRGSARAGRWPGGLT